MNNSRKKPKYLRMTRSSNATGYQCISPIKNTCGETTGYRVQITHNFVRFYLRHEKLEDAIVARDKIISEINEKVRIARGG